jgi:hypothetical protein
MNIYLPSQLGSTSDNLKNQHVFTLDTYLASPKQLRASPLASLTLALKLQRRSMATEGRRRREHVDI